jgi:uncharacterized protein (TIGR02145 family)
MNHLFKIPVIVILFIGSTIFFTSCKKNPTPPVVTTTNVIDISQTSATSGGNVTNDGNAEVTYRGVCWNTSENPSIAHNKTSDGTGTGSFTSNLTQLTANTKYYVRAFATNSEGTGYGNEVIFTTPPEGTVMDVDGNIYNLINIGTQVWMKENLKVTKYNNGDLIGTTSPATKDIRAETATKYQWAPNGDESNVATYGRLYTWYAVGTGKLCPSGWHVPSDAEWEKLSTFLGGDSVSGGKLKDTGTTHWQSPNAGATNETGFSALPGGTRSNEGYFWGMGRYATYWSSTQNDFGSNAWVRGLYYDTSIIARGYGSEQLGFSVRCIKDN